MNKIVLKKYTASDLNYLKSLANKLNNPEDSQTLLNAIDRLKEHENNTLDILNHIRKTKYVREQMELKMYQLLEIADMLGVNKIYVSHTLSLKNPNDKAINRIITLIDSLPYSKRKLFEEDLPNVQKRFRLSRITQKEFLHYVNKHFYVDNSTLNKALRGKTKPRDIGLIDAIYKALDEVENKWQ